MKFRIALIALALSILLPASLCAEDVFPDAEDNLIVFGSENSEVFYSPSGNPEIWETKPDGYHTRDEWEAMHPPETVEPWRPSEKQERFLSAQAKTPAILDVVKALTETAAPAMADEKALTIAFALPEAFAEWRAGVDYSANDIVSHNGKIYRIVNAATSLESQPPDAEGMLAVYRPIETTASGESINDPIPFVHGMDVVNGKYYLFEDVIYLAKSDMPACVWNPDTVGMWQWEMTAVNN